MGIQDLGEEATDVIRSDYSRFAVSLELDSYGGVEFTTELRVPSAEQATDVFVRAILG